MWGSLNIVFNFIILNKILNLILLKVACGHHIFQNYPFGPRTI
jgi:hypothetical protein